MSTVSSGTIALPDAGRDEALHGLVVVRAERPVRLEPRGAERRLDRLGRAVRAEADERLPGDLARATAASPASGEPAATTSTYGSRSSSTVSSGASPTGSSDEADVELAALERVRDLLVVELLEHHLDLRPLRR